MAQQQLINDLKKEIRKLKNEGRVLEALPLMKQAANWGDLENQKELVDLYLSQEYLDKKEAYVYARLAALNLDLESMYILAQLSLDPAVKEVNREQAYYFMNKAALGDYPKAYDPLSMMYLMAQGTSRNLEQAKFWNEKAKKAGIDAETVLKHETMIQKMESKTRN